MGKTHLVVFDTHAHPGHDNDRADLLSKLIVDVKPDVIIHGGDSADLSSLSSHDKGKRTSVGRNYRDDIDSHLDFTDRMFHGLKKQKKKLPTRIFLEGNHEHRIERALDLSPELEGAISFEDLETDYYYDETVRYNGTTPGQYMVHGITYAHFFVSGIMGRAISGEHTGYTLLTKKFASCTMGHQHIYSHSMRTAQDGSKIQGLVSPCFQDYDSDWAGEVNKLWDRGLIIKRNVDGGQYDLEYVSLKRLKEEYE